MVRQSCRGHVAYSWSFSAVTSSCRTSAGASLALRQYFSALDLSKLPIRALRYISPTRSGLQPPEHHPVTGLRPHYSRFNTIAYQYLQPAYTQPPPTPPLTTSSTPEKHSIQQNQRQIPSTQSPLLTFAQKLQITISSNGWTRRWPLKAQSHQVPKGLQDLQEKTHSLWWNVSAMVGLQTCLTCFKH